MLTAGRAGILTLKSVLDGRDVLDVEPCHASEYTDVISQSLNQMRVTISVIRYSTQAMPHHTVCRQRVLRATVMNSSQCHSRTSKRGESDSQTGGDITDGVGRRRDDQVNMLHDIREAGRETVGFLPVASTRNAPAALVRRRQTSAAEKQGTTGPQSAG
jgi:hypothetical protein